MVDEGILETQDRKNWNTILPKDNIAAIKGNVNAGNLRMRVLFEYDIQVLQVTNHWHLVMISVAPSTFSLITRTVPKVYEDNTVRKYMLPQTFDAEMGL